MQEVCKVDSDGSENSFSLRATKSSADKSERSRRSSEEAFEIEDEISGGDSRTKSTTHTSCVSQESIGGSLGLVDLATRFFLCRVLGFLRTRGAERRSVSLLVRTTFSMNNCSFSIVRDSTSGSNGEIGGIEE